MFYKKIEVFKGQSNWKKSYHQNIKTTEQKVIKMSQSYSQSNSQVNSQRNVAVLTQPEEQPPSTPRAPTQQLMEQEQPPRTPISSISTWSAESEELIPFPPETAPDERMEEEDLGDIGERYDLDDGDITSESESDNEEVIPVVKNQNFMTLSFHNNIKYRENRVILGERFNNGNIRTNGYVRVHWEIDSFEQFETQNSRNAIRTIATACIDPNFDALKFLFSLQRADTLECFDYIQLDGITVSGQRIWRVIEEKLNHLMSSAALERTRQFLRLYEIYFRCTRDNPKISLEKAFKTYHRENHVTVKVDLYTQLPGMTIWSKFASRSYEEKRIMTPLDGRTFEEVKKRYFKFNF